MPTPTEIFGDDSLLQFDGGTLRRPWGNAPDAIANRMALKACVQARNEGCVLAREGNEIIRAPMNQISLYTFIGQNNQILLVHHHKLVHVFYRF